MFRIKTALLACLLLTACLTSVAALSGQQTPSVDPFSSFAFRVKEAGYSARDLEYQLGQIVNYAILKDNPELLLSLNRALYILANYGTSLTEVAQFKSVDFSVAELKDYLMALRSAVATSTRTTGTATKLSGFITNLKKLY